jgi:hypothetical protein
MDKVDIIEVFPCILYFLMYIRLVASHKQNLDSHMDWLSSTIWPLHSVLTLFCQEASALDYFSNNNDHFRG